MTETISFIPSRVKNCAEGGHVAGARDIIDDGSGITLDELVGNKEYASADFSGMGRVVFKKNIVNGVNTLTQEMMSDANTIYVIQYDFTLGEDITVPENCVLEFEGGSISGAYTLIGNNTAIEAPLYKIFNDDVLFNGSYNVKTLYAVWFGLIPNNNQIEFGSKIQRIFNVISSIYPKTHWSTGHYFGGILLKITAGKYWATQEITIPDNLSGVTISGDTQESVIVINKVPEGNTLFKHTTLEGLWEWKISNITFVSNNNRVFYLNCYYNSVIEDCSFYAGNNTIKLGLTCGTRIKRCSFVTSIDTCILIDGSGYVGPDTTFFIEDCWAQHIGTFITLLNSKGSEVHILNTTIEYSDRAFIFNYVFNATFTNCYFEGNTNNSTIYASNVKMTGCYFASSKKVEIKADGGASTFICELPIKTDSLAIGDFGDATNKVMKLYFGNDAFIDYNAKEALYKRRRITGTYVIGYGYLYEVEYIDSTNGKYFKGLIKRSGSQWSMQEKYSGNVQPSTANNAIYFGESDDYDESVSLHVKMIPDYLSES